MPTISNSNINAVLNQKNDINSRIDPPGVTTSPTGRKSFNENFDDFLTLLVAQLKYQDPTDPADSSEFTNQLVLFSGVEQQISMNDKLKTLIASFEQSSKDSAPNYLGKEVEVTGKNFKVQYPGQNVAIHYSLSSTAKNVKIDFMDSTGSIVESVKAPNGVEDQFYTWSTAGKPISAGLYSYVVTATDKDNKPVSVTHYTTAKIAGVGFDNNKILLIADTGSTYPLDKVHAIRSSNDNQLQLQNILSAIQGSSNIALIQYIGKEVEIEGNKLNIAQGTGDLSIRYQIPSGDGVSAVLKILDSSSKEIYSKKVDFSEGSHNLIWDGKQSDGSSAGYGDYRIFVEVLDSKGKPLPNFIYTKEKVVSVDQQSTPAKLISESGQSFSLAQISRI